MPVALRNAVLDAWLLAEASPDRTANVRAQINGRTIKIAIAIPPANPTARDDSTPLIVVKVRK